MIYLNSQFDDILGRIFNDSSNMNYKSSLLSKTEENFEVNHTKDGGYLFFEAPGFNKTNLKVEMEDGVLHIEGKRTYKLNGEEIAKTISKKFKIGSEYDASKIEATIEDGLLTVFVPNFKKVEKRRISIL